MENSLIVIVIVMALACAFIWYVRAGQSDSTDFGAVFLRIVGWIAAAWKRLSNKGGP